MKRLEKVRVVQFFLFERQEILLEEVTGIFGPNASGKSSMLDAVQIAMFGGNSRWAALNAQADDEQRTTRSLRSYCLGQYGESSEDRARDNATTYISLIWRDTVTNEPLSMGVCISASADREGHEIMGRYLLPGYELHMGDHLEIIDGQERPREWTTFRHQLIDKSRAIGNEVMFTDAQRYVSAVLLALRGSGHAPHSESFIRAFRFALRMRFDKSVDQIVRNDVLESIPTNIKRFREVTDSFKKLAELVAQVEAKITDGKKVEVEFDKAIDESSKSVTWGAMGKMAAVEVANENFNQASHEREIAEEALSAMKKKLDELDTSIQNATAEELRFQLAKEAHSSHKDYGAIDIEIKAASQRKDNHIKNLRSELSLLCKTWDDSLQSPLLQQMVAEVNPVLTNLRVLLDSQVIPSVEDISGTVTPLMKLSEKAYGLLFGQANDLKAQKKHVDDQLHDARSALARIKEGRAPLLPHVQRLLSELEDQGLHPIPVCDLVKITDPAWQAVIEAYLSTNLQALLVSGDEETKAFSVYRNMTGSRAVYGAKLARESRQQLNLPAEKGSVAELIGGDHPAAVAYLRGMLNDIKRAVSDQDALAGKRTLTQDGMLVSKGGFERLALVPAARFMIGAGSAVHRAAQEQEVTSIDAELTQLNKRAAQLDKLMTSFQMFSNEMLASKSVLDRLTEIDRISKDVETKTTMLTGMADADYIELGKQEKIWGQLAKGLGNDRDKLISQIGSADAQFYSLKTNESNAYVQVQNASDAANEARKHPEYDHEYWLSQWDRLLELFDENPVEKVNHCYQQANRAETRMKDAVNRGMREFGVFMQKYREQMAVDATDWRKAHDWMSDLLNRLIKTDLASYREDMDAAYRTSQETFRNDVAIALHNNLEYLSETMDRLNAVLRNCPTFSNGERYRFRRVVRPHLESLLKFVKDVATYGPTQDLLGGAGEIPEEFKALLEDKITPGSGSAKSPLDDYREFFDFDIEILREDPVSKETKVVGHLSKRLGPGSGGEHRAPLYVIAGAALASAYRLDNGNKDGLRLMLLDEAFNKMDMVNIIATMRYLEALGLQVFMASPGENLGTLTAFLHRYYDILRDPDNNTVMFAGHSVSEAVRNLFKSDLPEFNPNLVTQEISAMRSQLIAEVNT